MTWRAVIRVGGTRSGYKYPFGANFESSGEDLWAFRRGMRYRATVTVLVRSLRAARNLVPFNNKAEKYS